MEDLSRFGPVCARQASAAAGVGRGLEEAEEGLQSCQSSSPSLTLGLEKGPVKKKSSLMRGLSSDLCNLCRYYKGLRVKENDDDGGENKQNTPSMLQSDIVYRTHSLHFAFMIPIYVAKCLFIYCCLFINLVSFYFSYSNVRQLCPHTVKR